MCACVFMCVCVSVCLCQTARSTASWTQVRHLFLCMMTAAAAVTAIIFQLISHVLIFKDFYIYLFIYLFILAVLLF